MSDLVMGFGFVACVLDVLRRFVGGVGSVAGTRTLGVKYEGIVLQRSTEEDVTSASSHAFKITRHGFAQPTIRTTTTTTTELPAAQIQAQVESVLNAL